MKLKAYSHNNPLKHIISHTVKRYLWLPFVMLALSMSVFVGTELAMENNSISAIIRLGNNVLSVFNNAEMWGIYPVFLIAFSIFSAYVMFSFLFKKKNSTMMLLTGVSRVELFLSRYIFGLFSTLVPSLASFFVLLILGANNVEKSLVFNKNIFIILSMFVMLIISTYTVTVIAIALSGRKLEFFAVCAVFVAGGTAILLFVGVLFDAFVHGFAYPIRSQVVNYEFNDLFDKYSWVSLYSIFKDAFNDYTLSGYNAEISFDIYSTRLLWFSVITFALIPLSVWLFKSRNAEYDGKSNAHKGVSAVCSIIPALALSSLIFTIGGTFLNTIIVLAVFTLLALLFYAFFNGTVREMFKSLKFILPVAATFAVLVLVLNFDLIGYSKKIPDIDDVESVVVSYKGKNDSAFEGSRSGMGNGAIVSSCHNEYTLPVLTTKDDIQTAMNIHEKIIADGSMIPSPQSLENYSDTAVYVDYNIVYKLKNGREIIRSYSVMKLSTLYSTLQIETTSAYREKFENIIKSGNNKPYFDKDGNHVINYDMVSVHASNNMLSDVSELAFTNEEKGKLFEAIVTDKFNETVDEAYHPTEDCLGVLWLSRPNSGGTALTLPNYIAVYKNDKNILSFLESKDLTDIFDDAYEIKSIKLYSFNYYDRDYIKKWAIDRSFMAHYNHNYFDQPSLYNDLGEVPKEEWDEILNKSYLSYFRDVGNKYAVITMTNSNGEERVVTKFIPE